MAASPPATADMRVLQLRSSAGLYGAERVVLALADGLRMRGARCRLLGIRNYLMARQPLHEAALAAGHDAVLLPCRGRIDMRTVSALSAQLAASGATVLHVHDYKSAFYAWLATRQHPRVKLVATLHGWVESSQALRLYTRLELALLRRFDALAVVAQDQAARLLRAGVPAARIHQVDNGIAMPAAPDPSRVSALRGELDLAGSGPVLAAVARLAPEKNLAMLLSAFAASRRDDARLLLVGDGPERAALEAQADALGLRPRVRFAGARTDMDVVWGLVDCLALPSLGEGMPLVVLEAMSRGIPVVASAIGDVPRLLSGSEHGRLVPPGDEAALREAIDAALAGPAAHDARAAAFVQAHHSADAMAARYLDLYQELAGHGRKTA
jgi:glycosyltransferase involved in cell wall biosynthesis